MNQSLSSSESRSLIPERGRSKDQSRLCKYEGTRRGFHVRKSRTSENELKKHPIHKYEQNNTDARGDPATDLHFSKSVEDVDGRGLLFESPWTTGD